MVCLTLRKAERPTCVCFLKKNSPSRPLLDRSLTHTHARIDTRKFSRRSSHKRPSQSTATKIQLGAKHPRASKDRGTMLVVVRMKLYVDPYVLEVSLSLDFLRKRDRQFFLSAGRPLRRHCTCWSRSALYHRTVKLVQQPTSVDQV
jgi:hypothetical protein